MRSCLQIALVSIALFFGIGLIVVTANASMHVDSIDLSANTPLIPLETVPSTRVLSVPTAMARVQLAISDGMRTFDNISADDSAVPGPADEPSSTPSSGDADPSESQDAVEVRTTSACNLRAGPGTTFEIVGTCQEGESLTLVARNEAGDWYELADGAWIATFLIANGPTDLPLSTTAQ